MKIDKRKILKYDLTGMRFGRLTVVERVMSDMPCKDTKWRCVCDCGNETVSMSGNLKRGYAKSCGCLQKELLVSRSIKHGRARAGKLLSPEYRSWQSLKSRCFNEKVLEYIDYGGRGITVCQRWLNSFDDFYADMGARPSSKHSIDRINVNGNYEPYNCRWATTKEQHRNKRDNHWIEYEGRKMVLQDWANLFGISQATLGQRLQKKPVKEVFEFSSKKENRGKYLR